MKKLTYSIGLIGSISLTIGVTFKLLQSPKGNEFFIIGFLMLLMIFIPLLVLEKFKIVGSDVFPDRLKLILGIIASLSAGLSGLFKTLHLQGADLLLIVGACIFTVGFLPLFFYSMYKKSIS